MEKWTGQTIQSDMEKTEVSNPDGEGQLTGNKVFLQTEMRH